MTVLDDTTTVSVTDARNRIGELARSARDSAPVMLTDHGHVVALLVSPELIANLEEALSVEQFLRERANGTLETVPHDEVVAELGGFA